MTADNRRQIRFELERRFGLHNSAEDQRKIDDFLVWLETILPASHPLTAEQQEAIDRWKGVKDELISADPLGADRARRTIGPFDGIGVPPDFGRKSA